MALTLSRLPGPRSLHPLLTEQPILIEDMPKGNLGYCVLDDYATVNEFFGF
jgi:hypothetical protein